MVVDVLVWIFGTMFAVAALLAVIRIIRGPSIIDRMVASDALLTILICVLVADMIIRGHTDTLPLVLALARGAHAEGAPSASAAVTSAQAVLPELPRLASINLPEPNAASIKELDGLLDRLTSEDERSRANARTAIGEVGHTSCATSWSSLPLPSSIPFEHRTKGMFGQGERCNTARMCWAGVTTSHASAAARSEKVEVARIVGDSLHPRR